MRRTPWDIEINRDNGIRAVVDFRVTHKWTARNCTGADRNHYLGGRDGVVGFLEGKPHVLCHRASNQHAIGMTR